MTTTTRRRWPRWVYGVGEEPDIRFSLANERTFLAWIRTAMALLAGGVAIEVVDVDMSDTTKKALAALLLVLGMASAATAWWRWARTERAIRVQVPLPSPGMTAVLAGGMVLAGILLLVVSFW